MTSRRFLTVLALALFALALWAPSASAWDHDTTTTTVCEQARGCCLDECEGPTTTTLAPTTTTDRHSTTSTTRQPGTTASVDIGTAISVNRLPRTGGGVETVAILGMSSLLVGLAGIAHGRRKIQ